MNSTKVIFAVALIAFCCFTFSQSLKCYVCDSKNSCRGAKKYECTPQLAINTRNYLDLHHIGVNMTATSLQYQCFREELKVSSGEFQYKGCIYNTTNACDLPLRPHHTQSTYKRGCNQCHNKDGCNPAGRIDINVMAVLGTTIMAFVAKYILSN